MSSRSSLGSSSQPSLPIQAVVLTTADADKVSELGDINARLVVLWVRLNDRALPRQSLIERTTLGSLVCSHGLVKIN
jgi:hypothetical protein